MNRRNRHLHVVRESKKTVDKPRKKSLGREIKRFFRNIILWFKRNWVGHRSRVIALFLMLIVSAVVIVLLNFQTFTAISVLETHKIVGAADNSYEEFADGILKYSRDGIAYLNQSGEEQWNQPYQIKTPLIDVNSVSAAIADKGGNDIMVFQKDGAKGEIHTTLPIEKISVSEQGIVCAVLRNESTPQIMCYDTAGNVLVEHKASVSGLGYPMDAALSSDGELLQVLYLSVNEGKISSKVISYNFGTSGEEKVDHQVFEKTYDNTVMASVFFMNKSVSAAVGDNCFTIFKGDKIPKEAVTITLDKEIKSVCHNEKYIGFVLKNVGETGSELRLYNTSGKVVTSKMFSGDYKNMKISDNQVILYDGKTSLIFLKNGIRKFDGEMNHNIFEIIPISGVNYYLVVNANGIEKVRLVR